MPRIQSPSSINTFKQCPRKYYYQYIAKLEQKPSIHLLRGEIVHNVLEEFFKMKEVPAEGYALRFQLEALSLFKKYWDANILALTQLVSAEALSFYLHESQLMVLNMVGIYEARYGRELSKGLTAQEAFGKITPRVEQEFISPKYQVRGFMDAIEEGDHGLRIMDYKTSKHAEISEAYRLQLAIYALLYEEEHGRRPDKVGIYFLKESEKLLDVNDELLELAQREIAYVHKKTQSDKIDEYPKKPSRLCKWSTGQCDFYEHCFATPLLKIH